MNVLRDRVAHRRIRNARPGTGYVVPPAPGHGEALSVGDRGAGVPPFIAFLFDLVKGTGNLVEKLEHVSAAHALDKREFRDGRVPRRFTFPDGDFLIHGNTVADPGVIRAGPLIRRGFPVRGIPEESGAGIRERLIRLLLLPQVRDEIFSGSVRERGGKIVPGNTLILRKIKLHPEARVASILELLADRHVSVHTERVVLVRVRIACPLETRIIGPGLRSVKDTSVIERRRDQRRLRFIFRFKRGQRQLKLGVPGIGQNIRLNFRATR
ncbi:MAG: hypothetical protein BWY49_00532 [Candidatus Omnitrophica bacterium ADurb.Bin314]|nr:MAG: hypothetical protein BWY49_00532 [Candidatus Omnitrophica bacterium ADurb.Bin314]